MNALTHAVNAANLRGVPSNPRRATATRRVAVASSRPDRAPHPRDRVPSPATTSRRANLASIALAPLASALAAQAPTLPALADTECTECSNSNSSLAPGDVPFVQSPSGLRYADLRVGDGASPQPGQTVVVEWVGYTAGYQAKKIESTRETDQPFVFTLGKGQAIPAFEEALSEMRVGASAGWRFPGSWRRRSRTAETRACGTPSGRSRRRSGETRAGFRAGQQDPQGLQPNPPLRHPPLQHPKVGERGGETRSQHRSKIVRRAGCASRASRVDIETTRVDAGRRC